MAHPVLATKLFAPKVRDGLVRRPRLSQQLRESASLTLLSAPAGFGKSTLLAEWLDDATSQGRAVAWVSLDATDSDPQVFWTYVLRALDDATDGGLARTSALHATTPSLPSESLLTELINELSAHDADVWLVLDDYHLIDSHDVHASLRFLLDHLPESLHLVVSTRADPDLPLARLRARGQLVEIRAADLRFDATEAAAYFSSTSEARLTNAHVLALQERTEGWIAALQLASLSLARGDDVDAFVTRFTGNDRFVVDYLIQEVLEQQAKPVREFLLETAVLDRLCGSLCDAVTGRDDGTDVLLALERANLFVIALDDGREWYRYHHLFADVLRSRLLHARADLLPVLHQRASSWYADHDLAPDAIRHALAAGDVDGAAHLMELAVPAMRRDRQDTTLHGWLRGLPDDVIRQRPVLGVFAGGMSLAAGDLVGLEARLDDAERALAAGQVASQVGSQVTSPWADTAELRTLPATIAVYRASLAQARGDATGTAAHAQHALDLAGPEDHLARAGASGFLAFAAWTAGDITVALDRFTETLANLRAAGNLVDELNGAVVLADLHVAAGRPSTAGSLARQALQRAEQHGGLTAAVAAELHVVLGELDVERGEPQSAREHLAAAGTVYNRLPLTHASTRWLTARARLAAADGDREKAGDLLDQAERLHQPTIFPDVRPVAAVRARMWIADGDLRQATDWARSTGLSLTDEPSYLREFEHLTLVRLHLAQTGADLVQVKDFLARLATAAAAGGRAGTVLETALLLARANETGSWKGEPMTDRELQVLRLLDGDLSGPQIAAELYVTQNTLRTHTKHIFTKLEVTTRRAAVTRAKEHGLL